MVSIWCPDKGETILKLGLGRNALSTEKKRGARLARTSLQPPFSAYETPALPLSYTAAKGVYRPTMTDDKGNDLQQ